MRRFLLAQFSPVLQAWRNGYEGEVRRSVIAFFVLILFLSWRHKLSDMRWVHWVALLSIPLAYVASQAGWIVAEVGRQPWAIQDLLPVGAAVSQLSPTSVMTTFFLFLIIFTVLLVAEVRIMTRAISKHEA